MLLKGLRPPSLFLAGGGSELEGLEEEDGRAALSWEARALGSPDLKFETEEKTRKEYIFPFDMRKKEGGVLTCEGLDFVSEVLGGLDTNLRLLSNLLKSKLTFCTPYSYSAFNI